jgi:hypothetical protein
MFFIKKPELIILDEYTIIPKSLLFVLLAIARRENVGVVICGDKDQLQNIRNTEHSAKNTSFKIASMFAK